MGALTGKATNVNGTGQNVGTLQDLGWSPQDIAKQGTTANPWQKMMKNGLQGTANGLQGYGQQQQMMQQPLQQPMRNQFYGQ